MDCAVSPEQPDDERQNCREQQTGGERKVKAEVAALEGDITRQSAEPGGEFGREGNQHSGGQQDRDPAIMRRAPVRSCRLSVFSADEYTVPFSL